MNAEDESLHNAIYESNQLVGSVEEQLKQLDDLRQELGLKRGASIAFMEHIPESSEKRNKAEKALQQLLDSIVLSGSEESSEKQEKRAKMARTMKNKLQI